MGCAFQNRRIKMIEDVLLQYGVLGLWTISLLGERFVFQKKIACSLDKLTDAIKKIK